MDARFISPSVPRLTDPPGEKLGAALCIGTQPGEFDDLGVDADARAGPARPTRSPTRPQAVALEVMRARYVDTVDRIDQALTLPVTEADPAAAAIEPVV